MSLSKCHIWREGWLSSEFTHQPGRCLSSSKKQCMKPGRPCLWRKLTGLKIRIFFCNQQRVLLLLLHRRNLRNEQERLTITAKKRIWKPTLIITEGSEWPLQWLLIFKTLLYSCHMNMSLSKCHIWREGWLSSEFTHHQARNSVWKRCLWRKLLKIRMILFLQYDDKNCPLSFKKSK